ncbi:MAG: aspartyl/glutamyl-tRNA amidotransferase subunit C [Sedimentibacter sp.]
MVTRDDIIKIAKLAKLSVEDDEIEALTESMAEIIGFADTIKSAVEDGELEDFDDINNITNAFHEDEVIESFDRELILKNIDGGVDGCFLVKNRERSTNRTQK